jgi:hypothetical protein
MTREFLQDVAKVLAVLFALLPGIAAAQQTMDPNTLWGRQGISRGPAQAIPFAVLFANAGVPAGLQSCSTSNWFNTLATNGKLGCAQPAIADISGFGTGVATALAIATNGAGGLVTSPVPYANLHAGVSDTALGYWGSTVASAIAVNNCIGALTYSTSTHTFGCNNGAGAGSVTTAGTGLSLTGGGTTLNLALTNTTVQATPSSPTGTVATAAVFMGLGASCHITPTYSGRIKFEFYGVMTAAGGFAATNTVRYGTSTAPTNGTAVGATGTQIGPPVSVSGSGSSTVSTPFANGGIVTGLTPGTAYWFDLTLVSSSASGSQSTASPGCNASEF